MDDYSDIMDHPHHRSDRRPHMSMTARAAQFSPFAALTGYDESVRETGRLTDEKIILDESEIERINGILREVEAGSRSVTVTYFLPDALKDGGSYTIVSSDVKKIDTTEQKIIMKDGTAIPIEDVFDISII